MVGIEAVHRRGERSAAVLPRALTRPLARCAPHQVGTGRCAGSGIAVCDACEALWSWREQQELRCPPEPPAEWFDGVGLDDAGPQGGADLALAPYQPCTARTEALGEVMPSPSLVALLDALVLDDLNDYDVVETVAAWDRVASWVAARQLHAVAALASRSSMNPPWPPSAGAVARPGVAGDELALRLGRSRRAAHRMVDLARALDGPLVPTAELLERGDLDLAQTTSIHRALHDVPVTGCLDVQDVILDRAPSRTPAQLTGDVQRALITLDPAGAQARVEQACRGRRVDRPRALPHGMAGLWAVLPAPDAMAVDAELDARARGLRACGDQRTLDQLRADLLTQALVDHAPLVEFRESAAAGRTSPRRSRRSRRSQVNVTVPLTTLLGLAQEPGELAGYGPIDPTTARRLAADGTWRRIVTDPTSGAVLDVGRTRYRPPAELADHVRHRDVTCARPGCTASAFTADLDHTVEFHRARGTTSHDNLGPLCPRDHQIKTDGGFGLTQDAPGQFTWTTPTGHRYVHRPGAPPPGAPPPPAQPPEPPPEPPPARSAISEKARRATSEAERAPSRPPDPPPF